jgi:hypothetical protein
MPQRFLRPGIRTSPRWNSVSHEAHTLYIAILTLVDDYGRYDGRASVLWAEAFAVWNEQNPRNVVDPQRTVVLCQELDVAKLIHFYEVDGRRYLQVIQWQERARHSSHWPAPPQDFDSERQRNDSEILPPSPSPSPSPSPAPSVDAGVPTYEEVKEFAACNGVQFQSAESFFKHYEGKNLWLNKHGRLINWRKELSFWADRDRSGFRPSPAASNPNPTKYINDPNQRSTPTA